MNDPVHDTLTLDRYLDGLREASVRCRRCGDDGCVVECECCKTRVCVNCTETINEWKVVHRFVVKGRPVGYYAVGKDPNRTRMDAYHTYKRHVSTCAKNADVPLPLSATVDKPLRISTVAHFKDGRHPDPENVHKGIVDTLFWRKDRKGSGDKYTAGEFGIPRYDPTDPRVEVCIEELVW